jgi:hypothetical protein
MTDQSLVIKQLLANKLRFNDLQTHADLCITQMIVAFSLYNDSQMINLIKQAMTMLISISTKINTTKFTPEEVVTPEEADYIRAILRLLRVDESLKIIQQVYNKNKTIQKGGAKCEEVCETDTDCTNAKCPNCTSSGMGDGTSKCTSSAHESSAMVVHPSFPAHTTEMAIQALPKYGDISSDTREITETGASLMSYYNDQIQQLQSRQNKVSKELREKTEEYQKKQHESFDKRLDAQATDLKQRQILERGLGGSSAVAGGITAYKFTNGVSTLLSAASSSIVNFTMKLGFKLLNVIQLGNEISECAQEAASSGRWITKEDTSIKDTSTEDTFPPLPRCADQSYWEYFSRKPCSRGETVTCEAWKGIDINEYTNITMIATIAGLTLAGGVTWLLTRTFTSQNKLIADSSALGIVMKSTMVIPTFVQLFQPSEERRSLEKRVVDGQLRSTQGTLQNKSDILKSSAEEYQKTLEYKHLKADIDNRTEQIRRYEKYISDAAGTTLQQIGTSRKRAHEEKMAYIKAVENITVALVNANATTG